MEGARRYLDGLVATAHAVLCDDLVGAYAGGSLALGAYQPGRSDIDVALVSRGALTGEQKSELVARLRHEALPNPARGLELVVYRRDRAGSRSGEPGFELELNSGAQMGFRATYDPAGRPAADGRFWYGLDRSILHQSGVALVGPPAAETFAEPDDVRGLLLAALSWWLDQPVRLADDAVLAACRALIRTTGGIWVAKVDAGRRLLAAGYQPAGVIRRAIDARGGGTPPSAPEARAFQQQVIKEIRSAPRTDRSSQTIFEA
jgi:hypothetical protein